MNGEVFESASDGRGVVDVKRSGKWWVKGMWVKRKVADKTVNVRKW